MRKKAAIPVIAAASFVVICLLAEVISRAFFDTGFTERKDRETVTVYVLDGKDTYECVWSEKKASSEIRRNGEYYSVSALKGVEACLPHDYENAAPFEFEILPFSYGACDTGTALGMISCSIGKGAVLKRLTATPAYIEAYLQGKDFTYRILYEGGSVIFGVADSLPPLDVKTVLGGTGS